MTAEQKPLERKATSSESSRASRRVALSALLIALGVSLAIFPGSIPVGPTRILPYQHMVNVIGGIIMGPWYAAGVAIAIGAIRNGMGTGTVFAFPGGIPGALVVGLLYRYVRKSNLVAFAEPIGTGIGALISALLVQLPTGLRSFSPLFGLPDQWQIFLVVFLISSIPGSILGYVIVVALRWRGVIQRTGL